MALWRLRAGWRLRFVATSAFRVSRRAGVHIDDVELGFGPAYKPSLAHNADAMSSRAAAQFDSAGE